MSTLFRCCTCCLAVVGLASWSQAPRPADTILVNGNVITVDDAQPRAGAVAIAGGRILALGTDAEVRAHETAATRVIDLDGRTVVPGLADNHFHSAGGGTGVDLSGARTLAEVLSAIAAAVRAAAPGAVVVTNSDWHEAQLAEQRLPLRRDLDAVAPDHPVVVVRGGHEYVLNSVGLARWGITADTPVPAGGEISRYDDGSLNGELIDAAKNLVSLDPPPPRDVETRIDDRLDEHARLHAAGLTSIRHPGGAPDQYELLAELKRRGKLRIRVNFPVPGARRPYGGGARRPRRRLARGAGRRRRVVACRRRQAGGRRRVRGRLDARAVRRAVRPRRDVPRIADHAGRPVHDGGVGAESSRLARGHARRRRRGDRLGARRLRGGQRGRVDRGPPLDDRARVHCRRRPARANPRVRPRPLRAASSLRRRSEPQAVLGTLPRRARHAAEDLTTGKLADLVVLSHDILTCSDEELSYARVSMTMVGGEIVYEAAGD